VLAQAKELVGNLPLALTNPPQEEALEEELDEASPEEDEENTEDRT
jgi:hypothetical protein